MTIQTLAVLCPTCQREVLMKKDFPARPFCSKRCKLIDLGAWAAENQCIPGDPVEDEVWRERED